MRRWFSCPSAKFWFSRWSWPSFAFSDVSSDLDSSCVDWFTASCSFCSAMVLDNVTDFERSNWSLLVASVSLAVFEALSWLFTK